MTRIQHGQLQHADFPSAELQATEAQVLLAVVLQHFEDGSHDVQGLEEVVAVCPCFQRTKASAPELQALARQSLGVQLPGLLVDREKKLLHVVAVGLALLAGDLDEAVAIITCEGRPAREREGRLESPLGVEGDD